MASRLWDVESYIDNLLPEHIQLIDQPVRLALDDYQRSIQKVVSFLSRQKEVRSIYHIGSVSVPGISDIDLLVIFQDEARDLGWSYRVAMDRNDSYVFGHGLYGLPGWMFEQREWLIPIYELKLVWGEEISSQKLLGREEREAVHKLYALEYLMLNLLRLTSQFILGQLKVRNLLCSLYAIRHDFSILGNGRLTQEQNDFVQKLDGLRNIWWENESESRKDFIILCRLAIQLALQALIMFYIKERQTGELPYRCERFQVGVNGYVEVGKEREARLLFQNSSAARWMDWVNRLSPSSWLRKNLLDIKAALIAIRLRVPPFLLAVLTGHPGTPQAEAFTHRAAILQRYANFMTCLSSEFAIFDVFRWHQIHEHQLKWNWLRALNRKFFGGQE